MKILALSDEVVDQLYSPRLRERFGDVDVVFGCGDLPFFYLEFIVTALEVPLYYVPGNHDQPRQYLHDGRTLDHAEGCEALDGRATSARLAARTVLLAGLGGSVRYNAAPHHQYSQSEMAARAWKLAPALALNRWRYGRALDIFISHAPPRGIHDASDPAHVGLNAFVRVMDWAQPRLWLHGHTHVYRPDTVTRTVYRNTTILNVYPYRVINYDGL